MNPAQNLRTMESEYAAGKVVVENLPSFLTIETTSICNLRCVMCPHSIGGVHRPQHLPNEVVDALANVMPAANQVQLHGIGEPMASPSFWRALDSATLDQDAEVSINTNLTLLNKRKLGLLLDAKPRLTINVSLDAATADTYRKIRGADFHEVLGNLALLRDGRGERAYPRIYINMTLMRINIEEAPKFVELAHRLRVDAVLFGHLNHWPAREMVRYRQERNGWKFDYAQEGLWNHEVLSDQCVRAAMQRGQDLGIEVVIDSNKQALFKGSSSPLDEASNAPSETATADLPTSNEPLAETIKDCRHPWQWAMITADGAMRPCCYGADVGNVTEQGFEAVWNGAAMQALRRDIRADRINPVCANAACKYVQTSLKVNPKERMRAAQMKGAERLKRTTARVIWLATRWLRE